MNCTLLIIDAVFIYGVFGMTLSLTILGELKPWTIDGRICAPLCLHLCRSRQLQLD